VRELTRLRFTRQDKDAQLNALRASLVQQRVAQQRVARSFRRRVGRFEDADIFAESAERARVRSADRLAVEEMVEKYQYAAVELAMVEMEVELVHWRDWLGEGAHGREGCEECERVVMEKEGGGEQGLVARKRMGSCWRGGERLLSPLNWEKGGGAVGGGVEGVLGKRAESVEEED